MKFSLHTCALVLAFLPFSAATAVAGPITVYSGLDLNAGPGSAHPNSSAAAASFGTAAAALGTVSTITFENAPLGSFSSLAAAPGVTMSGVNYAGGNQAVVNTTQFPSDPSVDGFNTTPGGANFVEIYGGSLLFTFATPVQFFGAYFTGVQTYFYQDTITFSDGTSQTINIPGTGTDDSNGALDFVGFTDSGASITSLQIYAGNAHTAADFLGIDDVSYQSPAAVSATPEPNSFVLLLTGIAGLGAGYRRIRTAR